MERVGTRLEQWLKIAFRPRKLTWRAYFELDGVEQGWNITGASSQTILGLFSCEIGVKIGSLTPEVAKKEAEIRPNMTK